MALIDEVEIEVQAGSGGNGCVSFRREKYIPFGGPNGGNGGRGGSVFLVGTRDKTSLLDFKYRPQYLAQRGQHGMGKEMDGRGGEDLILEVPLGTLVIDTKTGQWLADIVGHEQRIEIAVGGRGGRGNRMFATPTNRAPRIATPGEAGEQRTLKLEMRLLADIGLIGLPNAGKSTLLRAISNAKPKTADYPFTTLQPHLGVVDHKDQTFVVADLPGLIEGASQGAGLGHQFLRHVARNRILLHLVDASAPISEMTQAIDVIQKELLAYDPVLANRTQLKVFTKIDLLTPEDLALKEAQLNQHGHSGYFISGATRQGLERLLDDLARLAPAFKEQAIADAQDGSDCEKASALPA